MPGPAAARAPGVPDRRGPRPSCSRRAATRTGGRWCRCAGLCARRPRSPRGLPRRGTAGCRDRARWSRHRPVRRGAAPRRSPSARGRGIRSGPGSRSGPAHRPPGHRAAPRCCRAARSGRCGCLPPGCPRPASRSRCARRPAGPRAGACAPAGSQGDIRAAAPPARPCRWPRRRSPGGRRTGTAACANHPTSSAHGRCRG